MLNATRNFRQVGTSSWSYLGQTVEVTGEHGIGIAEALKASEANYQVDLQPLVALTPELVAAMGNDEMINAGDLLRHVVKGSKATMRMDNYTNLGVVSEGYGVLQNETMFQVLGLLASGKDMNREDVPIVETAGVIGGGKRAFVTMRMPLPIRINTSKDDIVNMYMLAMNSFDGSGNFSIVLSPIRQWCSNQLALMLRSAKHKISFRHTRLINERVDMLNKDTAEMVYRTLGMYDIYKQHFEAELEHLRNIKLSEKDMERILAEALLPEETFDIYKSNDYNINSEDISARSKNILTNAMDALENGVGQENRELAGTGLFLINGITTLFQNSMNWKDREKKFLSITEGNCYNKLQKAHGLVLAAAA